MADIKSIATATVPREFELSYSTTVEEVYENQGHGKHSEEQNDRQRYAR